MSKLLFVLMFSGFPLNYLYADVSGIGSSETSEKIYGVLTAVEVVTSGSPSNPTVQEKKVGGLACRKFNFGFDNPPVYSCEIIDFLQFDSNSVYNGLNVFETSLVGPATRPTYQKQVVNLKCIKVIDIHAHLTQYSCQLIF